MGSITAKMLFRSIRKSLVRYLAIVSIVALGVGFFAGLKSSQPAMQSTASDYMATQHMYDFRLLSTLGFTQTELDAFAAEVGVAAAEGIYFTDALAEVNGKVDAYHFMSLNTQVAMPALQAGRLPEKDTECLADSMVFTEADIGKTLALTPENDAATLEMLPSGAYTIVGLARSPEYISNVRGTTALGNGSIKGFVFVPAAAFVSGAYHGILLWCDFPGALYSCEYNAARDSEQPLVSTLLNRLSVERQATLRAEAQDTLDDAERQLNEAEQEYAAGALEAEQQLADAKKQLADAQTQVNTSRAQLAAGKKQIEDGKQQIEAGRQEIAANRATLTEKEAELAAGRAQLDAGWSEYNAGVRQAQSGRAQLDTLESLATSPYDLQLSSLQSERSRQEALLAAAQSSPLPADALIASIESRISEIDSQIAQAQANRQAALDNFASQEAEYAAGQAQLAQAKAQLDAAEAEYSSGKAQLDAAKAQLDAAERQLNESEAALTEAEAQLPAQEAQLNAAAAQIASGWEDYEAGVQEAEQKLADGRRELDDAWQEYYVGVQEAEEKLSLTVYTLDRSTNAGLRTFETDSGIVDSVGDVFPVFFILIAGLVCITTMTRMVNEERTQIGTLRAMGVGAAAITAKYLVYSGSAALIGCVSGFFLGTTVIPYLVWYAYGILYNYATLQYYFSPVWYAALTGISLGLTVLVTMLACRRELAEKPAELVRPKAPANGKRILLERVTPLWSRLGFLTKVTLRSALRRPVHIVMMLLGIGGCTALLLAGFGISDSIGGIGTFQYEEIFLYDVSVYYEAGNASEEELALGAEDAAFVLLEDADAVSPAGTLSVNALAAEAGSLDGLISLHTADGTALPFPGKGEAIVTRKVAEALGITAGDSFTLQTEDGEYSFTVSGIAVNYVQNYVYVNAGELPGEKDYALLRYGADAATPVAYLMGLDGVDYVSETAQLRESIEGSFASLDLIVLLLVVCSAALAFIIICNLTNISVMERAREIATVKVLGFRPGETAAYVLRENIVLAVFGSLLGQRLGVWLLRYVMTLITVEETSYDLRIAPLSYLLAFAITLLFTWLTNLIMRPSLERINMAESLKSVE